MNTPTKQTITDQALAAYSIAKRARYGKQRDHGPLVGVQFLVNGANPAAALQADGGPLDGIAVAATGPSLDPAYLHEGVESRVEVIPAEVLLRNAHARQQDGIRLRPQPQTA